MARSSRQGLMIVLSVTAVLWAFRPGNAEASCRYIPTVADGRFRGPFTISNSTQDLDFFFQPRVGRSYSVEALVVSEPYYFGNLSGNVDSVDCPSSDIQSLHRTESIDPGPADFLFDGQHTAPFYRGSFVWAGGGVGYADVRIGNTLANNVDIMISVTETTMFSPAWSTNGSYDTFYSFQNTTNASCKGYLTLYDLNGFVVGSSSFWTNGTVSTNTVSINAPRNKAGTATFIHDCPPGALLVSAAIANFTISPTPYYQEVKFQPVRAAH
jgi:hypothetical protein